MQTKHLFFVSLLLAVIFTSCQLRSSQASSRPPGEDAVQEASVRIDTLPFVFTKYNNMLLPALVNGVDSVTLMFHTAHSGVNIIAEASAEATSLKFGKSVEGGAWGGGGSLRVSEGNTVQIGNLIWEGMEVWEDARSGHFSDGKCGLDLFTDKVVEIDFEAGWILIHRALPRLEAGFEEVEATFNRGMVFLKGNLDLGKGETQSTDFLLHSGYSGTLLVEDEFVNTHQLGEKLDILSEKELKDSFGNVVKTKRASLPQFRIGNHSFADIPVGFFEGVIGRQRMSVLGGDLIKRFHLILDLQESKVYMKPNQMQGIAFSDF